MHVGVRPAFQEQGLLPSREGYCGASPILVNGRALEALAEEKFASCRQTGTVPRHGIIRPPMPAACQATGRRMLRCHVGIPYLHNAPSEVAIVLW
jgi:hypothetical protein